MNRHNSRILAMMAIYQFDVLSHMKSEQENVELSYEGLSQFDEDETESIEYDSNFYKEILDGFKSFKNEIDEALSKALTNNLYPIDRLSYVDRSILRVAAYEMLYTKTPVAIIINEAILITQEYVDTEEFKASKFNNKVLDNLKVIVYGK